MKKFKIDYVETMHGEWEIEAETEEAAVEEFWHLVSEGKIDLLDTEMLESDATAYPIDK